MNSLLFWVVARPKRAYGVFSAVLAMFRQMREVSSFEVNSVPATKYINGPKFLAAGAPMKWSPGTELMKPAVKFGYPSKVLTFLISSVERKLYLEISTS